MLLAGGASKEAWAVDSDGRELLIRRAAGGVIHQATLSLEHEFEVLRAAHEAGVKVPEPIAYLGEVEGREAFVMERIHGETIGRRIVKAPPTGLDVQLAEELAKIHAIRPIGAIPRPATLSRALRRARLGRRADPAIELGLTGEKAVHDAPQARRRPRRLAVGNIAVDEHGIVAVLHWDSAHLGDSVGDLALAARPRLALRPDENTSAASASSTAHRTYAALTASR